MFLHPSQNKTKQKKQQKTKKNRRRYKNTLALVNYSIELNSQCTIILEINVLLTSNMLKIKSKYFYKHLGFNGRYI